MCTSDTCILSHMEIAPNCLLSTDFTGLTTCAANAESYTSHACLTTILKKLWKSFVRGLPRLWLSEKPQCCVPGIEKWQGLCWCHLAALLMMAEWLEHHPTEMILPALNPLSLEILEETKSIAQPDDLCNSYLDFYVDHTQHTIKSAPHKGYNSKESMKILFLIKNSRKTM